MADFFSRVRKNINKGIATVSEKSSVMLETSRLKGQIAKLEDQRKMIIESLGSNVYMGYGSGAIDQDLVAEKCAEIKKVDQAIADRLAELEALVVDTDQEEVEQEETEVERMIRLCDCGAEVYPGAKFCSNCGKELVG